MPIKVREQNPPPSIFTSPNLLAGGGKVSLGGIARRCGRTGTGLGALRASTAQTPRIALTL